MMILKPLSAVAELERNVINERTQGGRKAKAKKGGYAYGKPKYGYDSVDGELTPNQEEQKIIKLIQNHRRSGKSYKKIADYLNQQNITTKQGGHWSSSVVHRK
jgi:DNA invertase Pin-like site-specific DNA recombinase